MCVLSVRFDKQSDCLTLRLVCPNGSSQYLAGELDQGIPYLSSAQSVPTVTNSHTAALHTKLGLLWHTANSPPACQCRTGFTSQYFNFPSTHLYQRTSGRCIADVTEP